MWRALFRSTTVFVRLDHLFRIRTFLGFSCCSWAPHADARQASQKLRRSAAAAEFEQGGGFEDYFLDRDDHRSQSPGLPLYKTRTDADLDRKHHLSSGPRQQGQARSRLRRQRKRKAESGKAEERDGGRNTFQTQQGKRQESLLEKDRRAERGPDEGNGKQEEGAAAPATSRQRRADENEGGTSEERKEEKKQEEEGKTKPSLLFASGKLTLTYDGDTCNAAFDTESLPLTQSTTCKQSQCYNRDDCRNCATKAAYTPSSSRKECSPECQVCHEKCCHPTWNHQCKFKKKMLMSWKTCKNLYQQESDEDGARQSAPAMAKKEEEAQPQVLQSQNIPAAQNSAQQEVVAGPGSFPSSAQQPVAQVPAPAPVVAQRQSQAGAAGAGASPAAPSTPRPPLLTDLDRIRKDANEWAEKLAANTTIEDVAAGIENLVEKLKVPEEYQRLCAANELDMKRICGDSACEKPKGKPPGGADDYIYDPVCLEKKLRMITWMKFAAQGLGKYHSRCVPVPTTNNKDGWELSPDFALPDFAKGEKALLRYRDKDDTTGADPWRTWEDMRNQLCNWSSGSFPGLECVPSGEDSPDPGTGEGYSWEPREGEYRCEAVRYGYDKHTDFDLKSLRGPQ